MNDDTRQLFRMDPGKMGIDQEYREYCSTVAVHMTGEAPSERTAITMEQNFQRYERVKVLEQDSEGNVHWLVRNKYNLDLVTLKCLKVGDLRYEELKELEKEANMLSRINHEHV